jgi:hypothetical protein
VPGPKDGTVTNKMGKKRFPFLYLWPDVNSLSEIAKTGIFQRIKDEMSTTGLHAYWHNLHTYWQNCTFIKNNGAFL